GIPSAAKRVDPLRRQTQLPRAEIIARLVAHFGRRHGLTPGGLSNTELAAARDLAETKFTRDEWTRRVP
ncbi:MAG: lipoate--protein ligase family protein, partial [Streptosporangiaceae bacterium]